MVRRVATDHRPAFGVELFHQRPAELPEIDGGASDVVTPLPRGEKLRKRGEFRIPRPVQRFDGTVFLLKAPGKFPFGGHLRRSDRHLLRQLLLIEHQLVENKIADAPGVGRGKQPLLREKAIQLLAECRVESIVEFSVREARALKLVAELHHIGHTARPVQLRHGPGSEGIESPAGEPVKGMVDPALQPEGLILPFQIPPAERRDA